MEVNLQEEVKSGSFSTAAANSQAAEHRQIPKIIFSNFIFSSPPPSPSNTTSRSGKNTEINHFNHQSQPRDHLESSIDPLQLEGKVSNLSDSQDNRSHSVKHSHSPMLPPNSLGSIASKDNKSSSPRSSDHQNEWWAPILPPGQLAQRLKRAQRATASSSSSSSSSQHQRSISSNLEGISPSMASSSLSRSNSSRSNPFTTSTTPPSTRNQPIWSSFAELTSRASNRKGKETSNGSGWRSSGRDKSSQPTSLGDEYEDNASGSASGGRSAEGSGDELHHHSHGYIRDQLESAFRSNSGPSSRRSSVWEDHSPSSGSNGNSPILGGGAWLHSDSGTRNFSRSTSSRRKRVMSEDGLGLGQAFAPGSSKTWSAGSPSGASTSKISRFSSTGGRESPLWRSDNDHTSDEETMASSTTTTTTTTRIRRTSTTYVSSSHSPSLSTSGLERKSSIPPPVFTGSQDGRPASMRSSRSGSTATGDSVESYDYPPPSRGGSFSRFSEHSATGTTRSSAGATSISSGSSLFDRSSLAFPDASTSPSSQTSPQPLPQSGRKSRFQNHQNLHAGVQATLNAGEGYSSTRRMPSRSAPGSRRNSVHFEDSSIPSIAADYGVDASSRYRHHHHQPSGNDFFENSNFRFGSGRQGAPNHRTGLSSKPSGNFASHRISESIPDLEPDMALINSLSVVETQLFSAGNLAMTLTRQLSGPLKPLFHFTLFAWISSVAFLTLTGFLIASYLLTMWDDVGNRGKRVGIAATQARRNISSTVSWGRRMLGGTPTSSHQFDSPAEDEAPSDGNDKTQSSSTFPPNQHQEGTKKQKDPMSSFTPFNWAGSAVSFVAFRLAPSSIAGLFENGSSPSSTSSSRRGSTAPPNGQRKYNPFPPNQSHYPRPSSRGLGQDLDEDDDVGGPSSGPQFNQLPPRPPLSILIPSILLTIFLALGAGLVSFFARKRAEEDHIPASKTKKDEKVKGKKTKTGSFRNTSLNRNASTSSMNSSSTRERKSRNQNFSNEHSQLKMYHNNQEGGYEFDSQDEDIETIC